MGLSAPNPEFVFFLLTSKERKRNQKKEKLKSQRVDTVRGKAPEPPCRNITELSLTGARIMDRLPRRFAPRNDKGVTRDLKAQARKAYQSLPCSKPLSSPAKSPLSCKYHPAKANSLLYICLC